MPQSAHVPAIYSQNLKTKGQIYFFDVRQARNGSKYLTISQSWIDKEGQKKRSMVSVFADNLADFSQTVADMQQHLS